MSDAHPGFEGAAHQVAARSDVSMDSARAIIGAASHRASNKAIRKNPRLKNVAGVHIKKSMTAEELQKVYEAMIPFQDSLQVLGKSDSVAYSITRRQFEKDFVEGVERLEKMAKAGTLPASDEDFDDWDGTESIDQAKSGASMSDSDAVAGDEDDEDEEEDSDKKQAKDKAAILANAQKNGQAALGTVPLQDDNQELELAEVPEELKKIISALQEEFSRIDIPLDKFDWKSAGYGAAEGSIVPGIGSVAGGVYAGATGKTPFMLIHDAFGSKKPPMVGAKPKNINPHLGVHNPGKQAVHAPAIKSEDTEDLEKRKMSDADHFMMSAMHQRDAHLAMHHADSSKTPEEAKGHIANAFAHLKQAAKHIGKMFSAGKADENDDLEKEAFAGGFSGGLGFEHTPPTPPPPKPALPFGMPSSGIFSENSNKDIQDQYDQKLKSLGLMRAEETDGLEKSFRGVIGAAAKKIMGGVAAAERKVGLGDATKRPGYKEPDKHGAHAMRQRMQAHRSVARDIVGSQREKPVHRGAGSIVGSRRPRPLD